MDGFWDSFAVDRDDGDGETYRFSEAMSTDRPVIPTGSNDPDAEMYASFPPVMDPFFFKNKERSDATLGALAAGAYKGIRSL